MKKFAKIMAVALVAVMALAAFVACGPATDPKKAEKALKDKGYAVVTVVGADSKLAQASLDLAAKAAGLEAGDIIATVSGTNGNEGISITYFKNAAAAKTFWDKNSGEVEKKDGWVTKRSGAMIYTGTEQAVKDAH